MALYGCSLTVSDFEWERERVAARSLPAIAAVEPEPLPLMQRIALLKMNPSALSRGLAARLMAEEAAGAFPSYRDYLALGNLGLCERPAGGQWHQITRFGAARAATIVKSECRRLQIHIKQEATTLSHGDARCSCTCGDWSWTGRAGSYTARNSDRAFGDHVATASGMKRLMLIRLTPKTEDTH